MRRILAALLFLASAIACFAQPDNTIYVKQFPGLTVGLKVSAGMKTCNPNVIVPCLIVIDPSLATYAAGTMPTLCAQCVLVDFRLGLPAGTPGAAGPAGPAGPSGGVAGAPGAAATISVGVTVTGPPGSSAAASNSGTSGAAVLNFTIPQGLPGPTGATGAAGPAGTAGGATGPAGPAGPSGGSTVANSLETSGGGANSFGDSPMYGGADATGCTPGTIAGDPPQDGLASDCNFVGDLLVTAYGGFGTAYPRAIAGYTDAAYADSTMIDIGNLQVFPYTDYGDSAAPDTFIQAGFSDSQLQPLHNALGADGTLTNYATAIPASLTSMVAWLGSPHFAKMRATDAACIPTSGTWSADSSFHAGVALQTSGSAVLTCTTPYPVDNDVIAVWKVVSGGSASATFAIDGTIVDTWNSGAAGTISTNPGSTYMWWGSRYALSSTPATHVYTVTVTSGAFSVAFFASPQPASGWLGLSFPHVFFGLDQVEVGSPVSGYISTALGQLAEDGWNVQVVNLDNYIPDEVSAGASSLAFAGGTYPNGRVCPASTVGYPHPGDCGHLFWSWAYLNAAGKTPASFGVGSFGPPGAPRVGVVNPLAGDYNAGMVTNAAATNTANTFTGQQKILPASTTGHALILQGVSAAGSSPSFVQVATGNSSAVLGSAVGAGHTIIAACYQIFEDGTPTVSDTVNGAYTLLSSTNAGEWSIWYVLSSAAGSDTVTCTGSGGSSVVGMQAAEYAHIGAVGGSALGSVAVGSPLTTGSVTGVAGGLLVTGLMWANNTSPPTPSASGFTARGFLNLANSSMAIADQAVTSGGSATATWTYSGGYTAVGYLISLTAAGGTPQQANLAQNEYNDGTLLSGVTGPGLLFDKPLSYASLNIYQACSSGASGTRARVTDSTVNTGGATIAGGGAYFVPAVCNGTNWVVDGASGGSTGPTGPAGPAGVGSTATQADVTSSRALGTTYTAGSLPVMVEVVVSTESTAPCTGSNEYITADVGASTGTTVPVAISGIWNQCQGYASVSFLVPAGYVYNVGFTNQSGGPATPTLTKWVEVTM